MASAHMQNVDDQLPDFETAQQAAVFAVCNSYKDLFLPNYPYPTRYDKKHADVADLCLCCIAEEQWEPVVTG